MARWKIRRKVYREIDRRVGVHPHPGVLWAKLALRFFTVYGVYVGATYPFVSRSKQDAIWVIGIIFAAAVTYAWCEFKAIHD